MLELETLTQEHNLRKAWPNEASDFTPWLAEHLEYIGDILGMDLELIEKESKVGGYSADILAKESDTENYVIIENQLEDSNHCHLGQLITYASGKNAKAIVWVVKKAREEHRNAIDWLNENTGSHLGFYLLEIELWYIGDSSKLAPKFNIVEQPNEWAKTIKPSANATDTQVLQLDFWQAFNDFAKTTNFTKSFKLRAAKSHNWYDLSVGDSRCHICIEAKKQKGEATVGIYIPEDKELYNSFYSHKSELASSLGCNESEIIWTGSDTKKASRFYLTKVIDMIDTNQWITIFKWYISNCLAIKKMLPSIL